MFLSISPPFPFLHSKALDKKSSFPTRATSLDSHQPIPKSVIKRISDKLRQLGYVEEESYGESNSVSGSAGEIFIPTPKSVPKYRVGSTVDSSWSKPETPAGPNSTRSSQVWNKEKESNTTNPKEPVPSVAELTLPIKEKESVPSVAELTLPRQELNRLIGLGIRLRTRLKIGKAGITEGIVNGIHERWRKSEIVKIQCEDLSRLNMKRTHETLERKTGGLVVWRAGSIIVLYRGSNYKYPYFHQANDSSSNGSESNTSTRPVSRNDPSTSSNYNLARPISRNEPFTSSDPNSARPVSRNKPSTSSNPNSTRQALIPGFGSKPTVRFQLPGEAKLAQEMDILLNGFGIRFADWWGLDLKPVDADLLPGLVQGFRKPFRVLPFGVKPRLTDSEMTVLRRLSRPLPCHFALGRNKDLQGLAEAMIKLWEKCEITKIAVKRGVQNSDSELMAEELKKLTGGTVLSRDSEFILFYRGKDFLPPAVSIAIDERRKYGNNIVKMQEERDERENPSLELRDGYESEISDEDLVDKDTVKVDVDLAMNKVESKLSMAIEKKERAEKLLEELEKASEVPKEGHTKESISQEERYMLRKIGLKMKPFLLLGRRGAFDGTVENMHLHWKYRELVKLITREKNKKIVKNTANILEKESGGILVSIDKISKGHAIIIYRGKNYLRPKTLRPKSLLNKREAMKRSLEAQRRKSLKLHVLNLSRNIDKLKQQMNKDESLQINSSQIEEQKGPTHSESIGVEDTEIIKESSEPDQSDFQIHTENLQEEWFSEDEIEHLTEQTSISNHEITNAEEQVCSTSIINNSDEKENSIEAGKDEIPYKAAQLSNKERLFLRKEALKMRKRPVLSVGRNNVISGVAKTIKTHFIKHPLAIVNIKGRADGTSVQQLILELEAATGAVLVSREPNKVILYRGWGEEEKSVETKQTDANNNSNRGENRDSISAELMEAIRVECGFDPPKE